MSYAFTLSFVEQNFDTEAEALLFGMNLVKSLARDKGLAKEFLREKLLSMAWNLGQVGVNSRNITDGSVCAAKNIALTKSVQALFTFHMAYWPKPKLLAIQTGADDIPAALGVKLSEVHFQNSTDQNYPFEDWSDNIPFFREVKADVLSMDEGSVRAEVEFETTPHDYNQKSLVYKRIFDGLRLDDWLYGMEVPETFSRIAVCGITSGEALFDMRMIAEGLMRKEGLKYL